MTSSRYAISSNNRQKRCSGCVASGKMIGN
jgi:hypothetical protein